MNDLLWLIGLFFALPFLINYFAGIWRGTNGYAIFIVSVCGSLLFGYFIIGMSYAVNDDIAFGYYVGTAPLIASILGFYFHALIMSVINYFK